MNMIFIHIIMYYHIASNKEGKLKYGINTMI